MDKNDLHQSRWNLSVEQPVQTTDGMKKSLEELKVEPADEKLRRDTNQIGYNL